MISIAVLGDGGWGTTLACLLAKKGYRVKLWGPFPEYIASLQRTRINKKFLPGVGIPEAIGITSDLSEAVDGARFIILVLPSQYIRDLAGRLKGLDLSERILVSAAKGIENKTNLRMTEVIHDVLGRKAVAVLSGPSIAYEVARGFPAAVVVASSDAEVAEEVQALFMTERLRVYRSTDVCGVELGGALKNCIAIGVGISDGLGFGANAKAALLTRGLAEMMRLGAKMGANNETFMGLSGLGDLVTTCVSGHSRNRWLGEEIGRGKKRAEVEKTTEMVIEGIPTTRSACELAKKFAVEMPITQEVYRVLFEDKDPLVAVSDLMTRPRKDESSI